MTPCPKPLQAGKTGTQGDTQNTAETLEAILTAPTVEALEDAVQSLPIDVEAFHDRMQAIEATEPRPSPVEAREAIAEALEASYACVVSERLYAREVGTNAATDGEPVTAKRPADALAFLRLEWSKIRVPLGR